MVGSPATSPARSPTGSPQKRKIATAKKTRRSVRDLIVKVVAGCNQRNGVSLAALKKELKAVGYNVEKNKERIKAAVKALVTNGTLVHTKGTGASGSFKLGKTVKARKKGASEVKKAAAKKGTARSPKKARKSPKKAKKQAANKAKSAKETKKRTAAKRVKSPKTVKTIRRGVSKSKKAAVKKK